ncbi:MAG: hypothetical protein ACOC0Z_08485, partial [Halohasta sp.]
GLCGCTAVDRLPFASGDGEHPFADENLGVQVEDRGETSHDVEAITREVLEYWVDEAEQYAGFEVGLRFVDDDPDIVFAYVDSPEDCSDVENYSSEVLGCAPLLRAGNRVPAPVTAHVVAADRPVGSIRTTAKHELGHILGLDHDAEPREIMSNRPEDRIPRYEIRVDVWETVLDGYETMGAAIEDLNTGIDHWNDESYDEAIDTFDEAQTGFDDARGFFRSASDRSDELDADPPLETVEYDALDDAFDRLLGRMGAAADAARLMGEASAAIDDGDRSTAQQRVEEANDRLDDYETIGAVESREIAIALGLVRGLDREDDDGAVGDGL